MIQPLDGRPAVVIYTVGAPPGTQPAGIKDSAAIIETVDWANNDRLIVVALISSKVNGKVENFYRALSADVTGSNVVTLFKDADPAMSGASEIADFDLDDPDHVFMPNIGRTINGWRYSLYRVNVSTGTAEFVRA